MFVRMLGRVSRFRGQKRGWWRGLELIDRQCRMVRGLDATAAQSFGSLRNLLQRMSVELIIVELENASATSLLHAHGVIGPGGCRLDSPCFHAEDARVLGVHALG